MYGLYFELWAWVTVMDAFFQILGGDKGSMVFAKSVDHVQKVFLVMIL